MVIHGTSLPIVPLPRDTSVKSWNKDQPQDGYSDIIKQWKDSTDPKPGGRSFRTSASVAIPAGVARTIVELKGEGSISRLRIHLDGYSRDKFFHTNLRIFWDSSAVPAVDMPLANFFGGGGENDKDCQDIHLKTLRTLMYGFNGQKHDFYCYWPMPYWRSARIELRNDGREDLDSVRIDVDYKPADVYKYPAQKAGYFYAKRTISKDAGRDSYANAFTETGRGHVTGISFYSTGYAMDGDEFTYIDGCRTPRIHGDGTEDDHNQGWGGSAYQAPLWGGLVNGFQGAYRLYLNDSYVFNRDIKINYEFSMEAGSDNGGEVDAVVFYYKSPAPGNLILTDECNVGDLASESAHQYVIAGKKWAQTKKSGYDGYERNYEYDVVRDNGYGYNKYCEFVAAVAPENEGVRLRRRIYRSGNGVQRANVYVDGVRIKERPWDICTLSSAPFYQGWFDDDFEIPASYTKGKHSVRIRVKYLNGGSRREINEFYYWVYSYSVKPGPAKGPLQEGVSPDNRYFQENGSPKTSSADFLRTDTSTKGSWAGVYGQEGFILLQYFYGRDLQFIPDYVYKVTYGNMKGHQFSSWNSSTVSSLNPNPISSQKKYLGGLETESTDSIELYVNDKQRRQLALYFCDFDKKHRKQDIEILDLSGNSIVPQKQLANFEKGEWLLYNFSGNIRIRMTNQNKQTTAVISALLFDKYIGK
jgi:hypothetical protein